MTNPSTIQTKTNGRSLPIGWQWVKLGDISSLISKGTTPTSLGHKYANTGIPFLRAEDVNGGAIDASQVAFHISEETNDLLARSQLQPNDFLITIAGTLGRVGYVPNDVPRLNCNQAVAFVRFNTDIDVNFVCYACQKSDVIQNLIDLKAGGGVQNLSLEQIRNFEIPLPPLDEQRRIASRLNEQLSVVESARKAAEEQLQAAYQLPSGYLSEMFESLFTKDTQKRKLGDFVISYRNGFGRRPTGSEDGGVIVLRLADVTGGKINLETPRRGVMTDDELETYSVKNGDLLFVRVNGSKDLVGRCAIVQDLPEVVSYNDHLIRARLNDEVLPEYIKLVTDTHEVRNFIVEKASTSAGQLTINQEMLSSLEIPMFSLNEQKDLIQEYKEKITESDSLVKILESQLAEIESLPASLLREAFAGQL